MAIRAELRFFTIRPQTHIKLNLHANSDQASHGRNPATEQDIGAATCQKSRDGNGSVTSLKRLRVPLSPGRHSELIRAVWKEFGPRFVPGGKLVYAGDTGDKWGYFDQKLFAKLGLKIDSHGKMPDVMIYDRKRNWLFLAEAVTSHGPVDAKRHHELSTLFQSSKAGLLFVTVFPNRRTFMKYAEIISWETEVWIADNPTHLIHFNGARLFGPYV